MMNRQGSHEKYVRATVRIANEALNACYQRIAELEAENAALQSWCKTVEDRLKADIDQQKEDMAEIERLRELLPKPEVRRAIRLHANGLRPKNGKHWNAEIRAWLERLEVGSEEQ